MSAGACGKHQTKIQKFLVCQKGLLGAKSGTLGPWAQLLVLILD